MMEKFFEQLTLVDFLGFFLPGSMLVLILNSWIDLVAPLKPFFGDSTLALGLYFICLAYVVGSISSELSKFFETFIFQKLWGYQMPGAFLLFPQSSSSGRCKTGYTPTRQKKLKKLIQKHLDINLSACEPISTHDGQSNQLDHDWDDGSNSHTSKNKDSYQDEEERLGAQEVFGRVHTFVQKHGNYRRILIFNGFYEMNRNFMVTVLLGGLSFFFRVPPKIPISESGFRLAVLLAVFGLLILLGKRAMRFKRLAADYTYREFETICCEKQKDTAKNLMKQRYDIK